MQKLKLKLDSETIERIRKASEVMGYSSPEEFIIHIIERELDTLNPGNTESKEDIRRKMEGLGYIE